MIALEQLLALLPPNLVDQLAVDRLAVDRLAVDRLAVEHQTEAKNQVHLRGSTVFIFLLCLPSQRDELSTIVR